MTADDDILLSHAVIQLSYRKGHEAAWKDVPIHFNPHPIGMPRWHVWKAGYEDALVQMVNVARRAK